DKALAALSTRQMMAPTATSLSAAPNFVRPPRLEEVVVTGGRRQPESIASIQSPKERFAPGTLGQAGPGVPDWRYAVYPFNWSGPVDSAQTVHFLILRPWLVGALRGLSVALLAALFARWIRDNPELKSGWRRLLSMRGPAVALSAILLACTLLCTPGHAYSTPDTELLNDLKARLSRPPKSVPNFAEIMSARIVLTPSSLEAGFEVAALSSVAVALPSAG